MRDLNEARVLLDIDDVYEMLDEVEDKIEQQFSECCPIFLVVANGALPFAMHIICALDFPLEYEVIKLTRYTDNKPGPLRWQLMPPETIKGRTVVIMEDIIDSGDTLKETVRVCKEMGARDVHTCAMLEVQNPNAEFQADIVGAGIPPNTFVFGFGLDYDNLCRNIFKIMAFPPESESEVQNGNDGSQQEQGVV